MPRFEDVERRSCASEKNRLSSSLVDFDGKEARSIFGAKPTLATNQIDFAASPDIYGNSAHSVFQCIGEDIREAKRDLSDAQREMQAFKRAEQTGSEWAGLYRDVAQLDLMMAKLAIRDAADLLNSSGLSGTNDHNGASRNGAGIGDGGKGTTGTGNGDGGTRSNPPNNGVGDGGTGTITITNPPRTVGDGTAGSLPANYNFTPPAQDVGWSAGRTWNVPPGYIFGVDAAGGSDQMKGVYAAPIDGWQSMVWRWKDTNRVDSITAGLGPDGVPSYKFNLLPGDKPDQGTLGGNPRSELFSVDQAEKTRQAEPPANNIVKDGDNVWLSFGTYIPTDFNQNQRWATLFQLKQQDTAEHPPGWSSISVHGKYLDFNTPMATADSESPDARVARIPISDIAGKWAQFTIHEKASTGSDGLYEVYMNGKLLGSYNGKTVQPGIEYHVQYGYYRDGRTPTSDSVYGTPIMEYRGEIPGSIPNLIGGANPSA